MPSVWNDDFRSFVSAVQAEWNIPGLAITVVDLRNGQTKTEGFNLTGHQSVTPQSVFPICSNTKLFTTFAVAMLVEDGKLSWDSKIVDVSPELQLYNGITRETLKVSDMLSHQSGYARYLEAEFPRDATLAEAPSIFAGLRPNLAPGQAYQYANIPFSIMGYIVQQLSGKSFASFVKERILEPLKMHQSSFGQPVEPHNLVQPYVALPRGGRVAPIGPTFHSQGVDELAHPPGGLLSTGEDIAKWLSYLLRLSKNELQVEDPRLIKTETLLEMLTGRIFTDDQIGGILTKPGKAFSEEFSPPEYGLGLVLCKYRGIDTASHCGAGPGAGSVLLWTPKGDYAVAVTTNTVSAFVLAAPIIVLRVLDTLYGLEEVDWVARLRNEPTNQRSVPTIPDSKTLNGKSIPPSPSNIAGKYYQFSFGDLYIVAHGGELKGASEHAEKVWKAIQEADVFGPSYPAKPSHYGIFDKDTLFTAYLAIYGVEGNVFWVEPHELYLFEGRQKALDVSRSMSLYTNNEETRMDFFEGSLEWYRHWTTEIGGLSQGDVTFTKA